MHRRAPSPSVFATNTAIRVLASFLADAGGTNINRWVSQAASAKCSQVTPTSPQSQDNGSIATLFDPMVRPLAKMALSGFTWYQGEANECPHALPVRDSGPCGGQYYACTLGPVAVFGTRRFCHSDMTLPNPPLLPAPTQSVFALVSTVC